MVRLRLHGTAGEIDKFLKHIEADDVLVILSQSGKYSDRGGSVGKRVYLDVALREEKTAAADFKE